MLASLNDRKQSIQDFPLKSAALADLVGQIKSKGLNNQRARDVYSKMIETGSSAVEAISALGFKEISEADLREILQRAIAANAKAWDDYKNGNEKAADRIKGAVMKETKGMAKMELVQRLLEEMKAG